MSGLHFAIVGCGKISVRHAQQASRYGTLVAVCDVVKERADVLAAQYNAIAYDSIDTLFAKQKNNIDITAICTPNGLHAIHSITALRAGSHVLCEKPLCLLNNEGEAMIEAARIAARKLYVVKSTRYNPSLIELKKAIESKVLGEIYSFQLNCFWNRPPAYFESDVWRGTLELDGGTLFTQFSHYIDALLWLLGDIKEVTGFRSNKAHTGTIEFEDNGVAALYMESGIMGGLNWSINAYQKNMEVSLSILAQHGSIRIAGEYMNDVTYAVTQEPFKATSFLGQANDYGFYKGSMSNHGQVYDNLILALNNDDHPFTTAQHGLKTVEAIQNIYTAIPLQA